MKRNKLLKAIVLALAITSVSASTLNTRANAAEGNWKLQNNNWYYMDSTGKAQTGWIQDNEHWCYLDNNGIMKTGWIYDNGNWFFLYGNGTMAHDCSINGYYLNSSGAWTIDTGANSSYATDLSSRDIVTTHRIRLLAPTEWANEASNLLTYKNFDISAKSERTMQWLRYILGNEIIYLEEAKPQLVGKIIDGKYFINDVKFYRKVYEPIEFKCDSFNAQSIADFLKKGSLYDYKSTSPYVYDTSIVLMGGNGYNKEEAVRLVVEFGLV